MTAKVKSLLEEFEHLGETDKRDLAAEILRRAVQMDIPALADDELIQIAEARFLEMDREESGS